MALLITDDCTACDACKPACPNEAISVGDPIYLIDALKCTECVGAEDEPQCKLVCPADCIIPNPDFVETQEELQAKYEGAARLKPANRFGRALAQACASTATAFISPAACAAARRRAGRNNGTGPPTRAARPAPAGSTS